MLQQGITTVEGAFSWAVSALQQDYPNREPVEFDDIGGDLDLKVPPPPPPPSSGGPPRGRGAAVDAAAGDLRADAPAARSGRRVRQPHRRRRALSVRRGAWRREWDSNPRWVAPHTLSKRADSAALASLPACR